MNLKEAKCGKCAAYVGPTSKLAIDASSMGQCRLNPPQVVVTIGVNNGNPVNTVSAYYPPRLMDGDGCLQFKAKLAGVADAQ